MPCPTRDPTDRYGRLLAYVTIPGTDLGRAMVGSGWAMARSTARISSVWRRSVSKRCGGNFHMTR